VDEFKTQYLDLLYRYQEAISIDKYDLGLAKNYKHKIHLKNEDPVYRKQFKIPEAHHNFIEQTRPIGPEWIGVNDMVRSVKQARKAKPRFKGGLKRAFRPKRLEVK